MKMKTFRLSEVLKFCVYICITAIILAFPVKTVNAAMSLTAAPSTEHGDTRITLFWSSVPDALIYEISRDDGIDNETIAEINVNEALEYLSYTDTGSGGNGLVPETTYTYTITAYSDADKQNEIDSAQKVIDTLAMLPPEIASAKYNFNTDRVILIWENGSEAAAASTIYRYTEGGDTGTWDVMAQAAESVTACEFGDILLTTVSPQQYVVVSDDGDGHESGESTPVTVTAIDAPVISEVDIADGVCTVEWTEYTGIERFSLERAKYEEDEWSQWNTVNNSILAGDEFALDIPPGAGVYRYRLNAKAESGYIGCSAISSSVNLPGAPTDLSCFVTGSDEIYITWTNDLLNNSGMILERKEGEDGEYIQAALLEKTLQECTDIFEYNTHTTYYYRIIAFESESNYEISEECTVSTNIPLAPSDLILTVNSATGILLEWTDGSDNENEFIIERKTGSGEFSQIATVGQNVTEYLDVVTAGGIYVYRVSAANSIGSSPYSDEVQADTSDVTAPVSLTAETLSYSQVRLEWAFSTASDCDTLIERKTGETGVWSNIATVPGGTYSYVNSGLSPNTVYYYRVRCIYGENSYSKSWPNNDTGIEALTLLGSLSLNGYAASGNRIYLYWTGSSAGTQLTVEKRTAGGSFKNAATLQGNISYWHDSSVIPGLTYEYRIKAESQNNSSVSSGVVSIVNIYLEEPTGFTAKVINDSGIELSWVDNSASETGFEIWRRRYDSATYELYAAVDKNITYFTDDGIEKGVRYYYILRAFCTVNNTYSAYAGSVSAGTGLVNAPENLDYSVVSNTQITLTWDDRSNNESGFKIERKTGEDGEWAVISTAYINSETYTCTGLDPVKTYYFRVNAYNYSYNSNSYSNVIEVSTRLPAAPENIQAQVLSASEVRLTWTDVSDNELGYRIERRTSSSSVYRVAAEVEPGTQSYIDKGLASNTLYIYRISAFNRKGVSNGPLCYVRTKNSIVFNDIGNVPWARDAILSLAGREVINGRAEGRFMPNEPVTRAEFTCMIIRAFGLEQNPAGSFADVNMGKWYYGQLMTAKTLGIIRGDEKNMFYPDKPITREDMAVITMNAMYAAGKPIQIHSNFVLDRFNDKNNISPYAISAMASLAGEGVLNGKPGNVIEPKGIATRAEAAVLIYRAIDR